ncbi:hypothetical protein PsYK624_008690 [Phanerochaete sordida]|uniref:Uncharacterized protein n=1 Tax=Phanerochaete sordida TaxID=48140 RepID=A0A9P3L8A6_9APHY|nr:hypothetical protein PsYK624_008690 [Phanerochaete sordida]
MAVDDAALSQPLQQLDVPAEFSQYDTTEDAKLIVRLEEWREKASSVLVELRERLRERDSLTLTEKAEVVAKAAQFDGEGAWIVESSRTLAQEILEPYAEGDVRLIEVILTRHVKAVFKLNAHPRVSEATGRSLDRPIGGQDAAQDHYEGQVWKRHPGLVNVLDWCIRQMRPAAFEQLWHLVVPPVMTLLDDYEIKYRLLSLPVVNHLLDNAPGELLRRTGINGLLITSFKTALTFLRTPQTPQLIRGVILAWLKLAQYGTIPETAERYEQLWGLLGEGLIETVWLYASDEPDTIQATVAALPDIVRALGLGAARYLKPLVAQLVHIVLPAPENAASPALQLAALRALDAVIAACAPRMLRWKGTILDGLCRRWVQLAASGADDPDARELRRALRGTCAALAAACPSVTKDEFARLRELDAQIFEELVAPARAENR